MTPLHVASLNLRMKIVSVLLKEDQVSGEGRRGGHVSRMSTRRDGTASVYVCVAFAGRSPRDGELCKVSEHL